MSACSLFLWTQITFQVAEQSAPLSGLDVCLSQVRAAINTIKVIKVISNSITHYCSHSPGIRDPRPVTVTREREDNIEQLMSDKLDIQKKIPTGSVFRRDFSNQLYLLS